MKFFSEFREFAIKGNAIDLAVGVIIGGAFGKIVSSLVNDVIMPPIGILVGGVDFKELKIHLKERVVDIASGHVTSQDVSINIGNFIQTVFDFTIIAVVIFFMVKLINRLKKKEEEKPSVPPEPSAEEKLLTEIRDLLKKQQS